MDLMGINFTSSNTIKLYYSNQQIYSEPNYQNYPNPINNFDKQFINGLCHNYEFRYLRNLNFDKLTHLFYENYFNDCEQLDILPNLTTLTHLTFGDLFDNYIFEFPSNLLYLKLSNNFTLDLNNLPNKLEYLELGNKFNNPLDNLPTSLKYLVSPATFSQSIDYLPSGLLYLKLGYNMANSLYNLPSSLNELILDVPINSSSDLP